MPDHSLNPQHTLVCGMTGSGKTTFVNLYLLNLQPAPAGCFIFHDLNRVWPRLKLTPCYTAAALEESLATELVCFKLMSSDALRAVEKLWRDSGIAAPRELVAGLPLGSFQAWNRLSGGSLAGKVF